MDSDSVQYEEGNPLVGLFWAFVVEATVGAFALGAWKLWEWVRWVMR